VCVYFKQLQKDLLRNTFWMVCLLIIFSNGHSLFTTVRYNFFSMRSSMFDLVHKKKKSCIERIEFWCFFDHEGKRIIRFLYHLKLLNVQFQILSQSSQNVNTHLANSRFFFFFFTVEGSIIMYQPITGVEFNCLFYIWNCNPYMWKWLGNLYLLSYVIVFDCKIRLYLHK
jgi:hypothetical protein